MAFLFWNKKKKQTDDQSESGGQVEKIEVNKIIPNRFQPRQVFSPQKITELAETIKEHGLLQPIVVREYETDKYEIIAGERRFRAVKYLGWDHLSAIVRKMDDTEAASMAVIENLQREGLTSIEEAEAYQSLLSLNNLTQTQLADQLGKSQSFIANKLRLLKLSPEVQRAILERAISERHGRALVKLSEEKQVSLLSEIVNSHLSVKETEKRVNKLIGPRMKPKNKPQANTRDPRNAVNTIEQSIKMVKEAGMNVSVKEETTNKTKKIIIEIPLDQE